MGNGSVRLANQVAPNSKNAIEEKDITTYESIVDKIGNRLTETWRNVPHEHIPQPSPEQQIIHQEIVEEHPSPVQEPVVFEEPVKPAPIEPSFIKTGAFVQNLIGGKTNIFSQVQVKAKEAALRAVEDKSEFMRREEQRKRFLEEEKLHTMKKIVEYQREVDEFPQTQQNLLEAIEKAKTNNTLVTDMLAGIMEDKTYLNTVRDEKDRIEQEMEEAAAEEGEAEMEEEVEME